MRFGHRGGRNGSTLPPRVRGPAGRHDREGGVSLNRNRWMSCSRHDPTLSLAMFAARNRIRLDPPLGNQGPRSVRDTLSTGTGVAGHRHRSSWSTSCPWRVRTRENEPG